MHSLKNTVVAVGLLAVSFGLYQVSLTPNSDPTMESAVDFSDGISELANNALTGAESQVAGVQAKISDFKSDMASISGAAKNPSGFPASSPSTTQPPSLQPLANLSTTRPPATPTMRAPKTALSTIDQNNVQTIQYPQGNGLDQNAFPKMKMPESNTFDSKPPEIAQRKPVDAKRDQGLINALENQMQFEATNSTPAVTPAPTATPARSRQLNPSQPVANNAKLNASMKDSSANNSFAANSASSNINLNAGTAKIPQPKTEFDASGEFQFSENSASPKTQSPTQPVTTLAPTAPVSSTVQSIAASDSSFNRLASNTSPAPNSTATDISRSNSFDSNVHLAGTESASTKPAMTKLGYSAVWPKVDQLVAAGKHREALKLLSGFYNDESLNGPQRQRLLPNLDVLAGKVIYSRENHLEPESYIVSPNESLTDIAKKWNVPAQLIYNINQTSLPNPAVLTPGTELKIVRGPFRTEINLQDNVMTMFLDDLYAGRFPIRVGISGEPKPGEFKVLVKSEVGHAWRDSNGVDYPPGAPENGYGPNWIGLSNSLCVHAISDSAKPGHHGCIGLSEKDAKDVFAILAKNSDVKILR